MMLADECLEAFCETDEAHGERAVLEDLGDAVIRSDGLGVNPDTLADEERIVAAALGTLDLEAMQELTENQLGDFIKSFVELLDIALGLDGQARQVDAGKAQIAAAAGDLALRIVDVAHDPCPAAHVGNLGIVIIRLVVLQVEGGVEEAEIREQALGGSLDGQLEEIVVGISRIVVHALFDLEDLDRAFRHFRARPS